MLNDDKYNRTSVVSKSSVKELELTDILLLGIYTNIAYNYLTRSFKYHRLTWLNECFPFDVF
jgi:hypothetical protein